MGPPRAPVQALRSPTRRSARSRRWATASRPQACRRRLPARAERGRHPGDDRLIRLVLLRRRSTGTTGWPPAGSYMGATGQGLMAADIGVLTELWHSRETWTGSPNDYVITAQCHNRSVSARRAWCSWYRLSRLFQSRSGTPVARPRRPAVLPGAGSVPPVVLADGPRRALAPVAVLCRRRREPCPG